MPKPNTEEERAFSSQHGGNTNVVEGLGVFGPNPEEKIREVGNVRTFYKRYGDGTITKQVWTELSLDNLDISKEEIDNTIDWNSL